MIPLSSLRHSPQTNLIDGRISNHDAALMIISNYAGVITTKQLKSELRAWRSNRHLYFTYLFNMSTYGGYGYVGKDVNSTSKTIYRQSPERDGHRSTYWYRKAIGVYAVTILGMSRLAELSRQC